jgi:transposase
MISREAQVEINFYREQLPYREIARRTGKDRRTVKRYAENPELLGQGRAKVERASKLDPFASSIKVWAEDNFTAARILDRIRDMGYTGGYTIVKDAVKKIKEENRRIAYVRFETEPGRQAQVDFGDFKVVEDDGSEKTLYKFSMILGFSRGMYSEFLEECNMANFLDAHQRAFAYLGGVPMEIVYDRMKNVYLGKLAGKDKFTQGLMNLANHYGFSPMAAPAYSPWVKGKIERTMSFEREGFWRGYEFTDIRTANLDLLAFLERKSQRVHGTTRERVCDRLDAERKFLMALPPSICDVSEKLYRKVYKDCTISVDGSRYEVPHTLVGKKIIVRLKDGVLRIFDGDVLVATHNQSTVKGKLVQLPGLRDAIRADREMNARKWMQPKRGKGKATRSPISGKYEVDVQVRNLDIYARIGGEVAYA